MSDTPYGLLLDEPPYFQPPAPPPPPPPAPTPPKRRPIRNVLAGIAVFVLFVLLGSAVGSQLSGSNNATATKSTTSSPAAAAGGAASASTTATGAVDAAVVDITTTLDGGAAAGTGIVISSVGLVLTNNHVIEDSTSIKVQIAGTGPTYTAHVLGYDAADDLALLQIEDASNLATVPLGDSSTVRVGDAITAIGNALGRPGPHAVTTGSVTALNQPITASDGVGSDNGERLTGLIEFNAALQPGDSGGPLVNADGNVVGIDTAATVGGNGGPRGRGRATTAGTGYAIPINKALEIADKIKNGESSSTIHIGDRAILGVQIANGLTVSGVESGGPAEAAGIQAGDVITSVDGTNVSSVSAIQRVLNTKKPGDNVDVQWTDSSGRSHTATLTLEAGPPG